MAPVPFLVVLTKTRRVWRRLYGKPWQAIRKCGPQPHAMRRIAGQKKRTRLSCPELEDVSILGANQVAVPGGIGHGASVAHVYGVVIVNGGAYSELGVHDVCAVLLRCGSQHRAGRFELCLKSAQQVPPEQLNYRRETYGIVAIDLCADAGSVNEDAAGKAGGADRRHAS